MLTTFLIFVIIALVIALIFFITLAWISRALFTEFGEMRTAAADMEIADFIERWTAIGVKFWKDAQK